MKTIFEVLAYIIWGFILAIFIHLLTITSASAETLEQVITKSARQHGVDPSLALAIAKVESRLDDSKIGSLGEIGVFQLRPEFHRVVKGRTKENIDLAMKYLARLKMECRGYGDAFFVCYNYGSARKLKYPQLFPYYKKVKLVLEQKLAQKD